MDTSVAYDLQKQNLPAQFQDLPITLIKKVPGSIDSAIRIIKDGVSLKMYSAVKIPIIGLHEDDGYIKKICYKKRQLS